MFRGLLLTFIFFSTTLFAGINPNADIKPVHEALLTKITALAPIEVINRQPPTPRVETPPPQPNPQMIWIPGYWAWDRNINDFVWVCGIWRLPPTNSQWVAGYWKENNGWYWVGGYWQATGAQVIVAQVAPPTIPEENTGNPPNANYFWAPGYWNYSGQKYTWLSGSWQPFQANLVFVPAFWQWRPEGYMFHAAFWDWTLEVRGVAYDCNAPGGTLIPLTSEVIISRIFFCYPDYLLFFWFHWHCCPDFWDDCWCLPPWWGWWGWWTFSWGDAWWFWWWWGHPGFPPPPWIVVDPAFRMIPPPTPEFARYMEGEHMPLFMTDKGVPPLENWLDAIDDITGNRTPLLPTDQLNNAGNNAGQGLPNTDNNLRPSGTTPPGANVPRPPFGNQPTPGGTAPIPPTPPSGGGTAPIPPVPQYTPQPTTPSVQTPNYPNYQPDYPEGYQPPNFTPNYPIVPPNWNNNPPRRPQPPQTQPNYPPTPNWPNYTPQTPNRPNVTPPQTDRPNYTPPQTNLRNIRPNIQNNFRRTSPNFQRRTEFRQQQQPQEQQTNQKN